MTHLTKSDSLTANEILQSINLFQFFPLKDESNKINGTKESYQRDWNHTPGSLVASSAPYFSFLLVLVNCDLNMTSNLGIITLTRADYQLQVPMRFFSVILDYHQFSISAIIHPKMLVNLMWVKKKNKHILLVVVQPNWVDS